MRRGARAALLLVLALALVALLVDSVRDARRELLVTETCDLVASGQPEEALARSEDSRAEGSALLECRAFAHLALGAAEEAAREVRRGLARAPEAALDAMLAERLSDALYASGAPEDALVLVRAGLRASPARLPLRVREVRALLATDVDAAMKAAVRHRRETSGDERVRFLFATLGELERLEAYGAVLQLTAPPAPPLVPERRRWWHASRVFAFAMLGEPERVLDEERAWRAAGDEERVITLYGDLALGFANLQAGQRGSTDSMLAALRAYAAGPALEDVEPTAELLADRLIYSLFAARRDADARAVQSELRALFPRFTFDDTLDELISVRELSRRRAPPSDIELRLSGEQPFTVVVSRPEAQRHLPPATLASGTAFRFARAPEAMPIWVQLRDDTGASRGSASLLPTPGEDLRLSITPEPQGPALSPVQEPRPGDGKRRVFAVLLDGGDWRLWRGADLVLGAPFLRYVDHAALRGRLLSSPPQTATAIAKIVRPSTGARASFVEEMFSLGVQTAQVLEGQNLFAPLSLLLPDRPDVFEALARGGRSSVNLLLKKASIDPGRVDMITRPDLRREPFARPPRFRALRADELALLPNGEIPAEASYDFTEVAGAFDALEAAIRDESLDFAMVHVDGTDTLAHATGNELRHKDTRSPPALLSLYRYVDHRLASVLPLIDDDDVLVVFSDHGIRNSVEHDEQALFLALGGGLRPGTFDELMPLDGVPHLLLSLLGVDGGAYPAALTRRVLSPAATSDSP